MEENLDKLGNKASVQKEIRSLKSRMNKYSKSEQDFSKNIFGNKSGLYTEKAPAKSKEEEAAEKLIQDAQLQEQ